MTHRAAVHDLKSLVLSFHPLIAIETVEEERVRALIGEVAADLNLPFYEWSVTSGFNRVHGHRIDATDDPQAVLRHIGDIAEIDAIYLLKDLSTHLANANVSRALRELAQRLTSTKSAIVLTGDPIELPKEREGVAIRFALQLPDADELRSVVRAVIEQMSRRQRVQVDLSRDEAQSLVRALSGLTANQARQVIAQAIVNDGRLAADDMPAIMRCKGELIERGGILEFFAVEENSFELGGFPRLKSWLADARVGFTAEARALNLEPPKGVLLVGVQGCGKSLAAKFIAREWQLPLLKLDAGRLYEKYVGESEKNFRRATATAEAMAPVILWVDEIEKAFGQASGSDADGGLSQRLFGAFLTWLQEKKESVFVVGAANDLTRVPPELLRKGRFDEIFFVDLPTGDERRTILTIHLGLRRQNAAAFDLDRLAAATDGFSGAELEQAVISSLYRALQRKVPPSTETILEAVRSTVPLSVSRREDVDRIRAMAAGRFTPVA
jgi:hypothetical protein